MGAKEQFESKDIIVFNELNGMNTQSSRFDLDEKEAAWMENLQPIGKNNLLSVPAPAAVLHSIAGEVITKEYYFNGPNSTDYVVCFCVSGSAYVITNPGGVQSTIAVANTFSLTPDCTQLGTQRILIADSKAGYCTWDGTIFVKEGGVSPNITITAGGSGYSTGATAAITGGTGSGATATVQVTAGVVTGITLTNAGTGYLAGDTLVITISPVGAGSGATAAIHVWPFVTPNPTTIAVFSGRVWLAQSNVVTYTGTGAAYGGVGYDDFKAADASGSFTINDPDLVHSVTALRALNNYLFIFGDNSVKQIGNISVSGSTTSFTLVTLTSDQGTIYRDSIVSFNRLVLFANTVGVYAIFGTSVEKISDKMDGIFRLIDFSQVLSAAVNDISNIHCFMLLVRYTDPAGTRSIILSFQNKKWFVISQGDNLKFIVTGIVSGTTQTFSTSGNDVTEILADPTTPVDILLSTSLTSKEAPYMGKKTIRYAVVQESSTNNTLNLLIESERTDDSEPYATTDFLQFVDNNGNDLNFIGSGSALISFTSAGQIFLYQTGNTKGVSGIYLGGTLTGSVMSYSFNSLMIEYGTTAAFANSGA